MISRDPNVSYTGFVQDFDYGLNWKNLLAKLGLADEWDDWDEFVRDECAKLVEKREKDLDAQWQKQKDEIAARQARQASDGLDIEGDVPTTIQAGSETSSEEGSRGQASQFPGSVARSLDTEDDPTHTELDAVEERVGVEVPIAGPRNEEPLSEEETKRQCKQRTVRSPSAGCLFNRTYIVP